MESVISPEIVRMKLENVGIDKITIDKFFKNYREHPDVWRYFEQFTLNAINAGRKLGAKAIMERVRWEVEISTNGNFKVSNSFVAYYARVFAIKYPEHGNYFNFKRVKGIKNKYD